MPWSEEPDGWRDDGVTPGDSSFACLILLLVLAGCVFPKAGARAIDLIEFAGGTVICAFVAYVAFVFLRAMVFGYP